MRTDMNLIAIVDKNFGIGYEGNQIVYFKEDLLYFKEKTQGQMVIMGRKTAEELPNQKPLVDRTNIVLSKSMAMLDSGFLVASSLDTLEELVQNYDGEIFVIGGQSIYEQLLPFCKTAYITKVDEVYPADRFICDFDKMNDWKLESVRTITSEGKSLDFCKYFKI